MLRATRWSSLLTLWVAAFVAVPGRAQAAPAERAYVGVYLHDVTRFDQRNGTYDVDADVWLKWYGELDPSALRVQNSCFDMEMVDLGESSDGDWHSHRYHLRGMLRGEFPLHRFPFDTQHLGIQFELSGSSAELVPDLTGSGMASRFSVTGWDYEPEFQPRMQELLYASDLGSIEGEGRSTTIQRVGFEVTLQRPTITIAVKLFLPLLLLLLIALFALYLAPDLVDARTSIGVTVLLACFAFQFTVAGTIPDVSYLTVVDELFILAYALSTLTLVVTVAAYWLSRTDRTPVAHRLDRYSRRGIPVIALVATILMLDLGRASDAQADVTAQALPARATSTRDVLRVGTLQLTSASYGVLRGPQRAGLTTQTPEGELVGQLAVEAPGVTNDLMNFRADGTLVITWTLRADLRWSDGEPLTSDDFRFALEVSPDPNVLAIETPDERTLVLTYADAMAYALEGFYPLPRHALLEAIATDGGFDAVREARRNQALPSAGPYALTEFAAGQSAVLTANEHYAGPAPAIARIEVRVFDTVEALVAAFSAGEIDIVEPGTLTPEVADQLERERPSGVIVRPAGDMYALTPDERSPLLARLEVRRAILQAIDRPTLAAEIFGPFGRPAQTPSVHVEADAADALPYDPEAARAALEAAGVLGETIRLTHTDRAVDQQVAARIAQALTDVGLVVEDHEVSATDRAARGRDHGGLRLSMIRDGGDDSDPRRYWNLPRANGRFDPTARTFAFDDATAEIVDRWGRALYTERRLQLLEGMDRAVAHRLPLLPLVFGSERLAVDPALDGWDSGRRFGDTVADWHFQDQSASPTD
ncbi:MAG: hypothetical protein KC668_10630 [Myxococcales bacterium]|nr:hypothetical protein [Myxococcales bacterium]